MSCYSSSPTEIDDSVTISKDCELPDAKILNLIRKAHGYIANPVYQRVEIDIEAIKAIKSHAYEFISFITSVANDQSVREQRKTMRGEDLVTALDMMGYDSYSQLLDLYLLKYNKLKGK